MKHTINTTIFNNNTASCGSPRKHLEENLLSTVISKTLLDGVGNVVDQSIAKGKNQ
jgi:hypothetical protein